MAQHSPGAAPQAAPHPGMGQGPACREGDVQRPLCKISPASHTSKSPWPGSAGGEGKTFLLLIWRPWGCQLLKD